MIYTDDRNQQRTIRPRAKDQVFITVKPDSGRTKSGILLHQHEDFPITQGYIEDLPRDTTYINQKYPQLQIGSFILFARYANVLVCEDHFRDINTDMPVVVPIYALCVDDIRAMLNPFEKVLV